MLPFCRHFITVAFILTHPVAYSTQLASNKPKFPMLFFEFDDIADLRRKAMSSHAKIADQLKIAGHEMKSRDWLIPPESYEKFSERWNEIYGNRLCAHAMYCLLYPDDTKAFEKVILTLDRFSSYPDWYVASNRKDQVPIGHSLTGFATAFDFLYQRFELQLRRKYLDKMADITSHMYSVFVRHSGWPKQHIHNHAPTNVLAMLLGAMILEKDGNYPEASKWKKDAAEALEKGMEILSYVIDGTSDEGVPYGSYSSRGWTQWAFLARRHFDIDHSGHPWFRAHFWYFYGTVLPGFQRTIGIADSNHHWFHGPESQLYFLDSFVMKNGFGNWLAYHVRAHRASEPPFSMSESQKFSCLHTEFIFYDATIEANEPTMNKSDDVTMRLYSDWGVVTYNGSREAKTGTSFLSFKSGAINGGAVADMVEGLVQIPFVNGWSTFNAGHEHHDQNTFVFAPNGRYFITEALYAHKKSYLDNALMFYPTPNTKCLPHWQGQTGGCEKWLKYKVVPVPRGKIVTTSTAEGMVHFAGEAVDAYPSFLQLKSVQRSMVLLRPDLLLVLDSVYIYEGCRLTKASANFHNILHSFKEHQHGQFKGAKIIHPDGSYSFFAFQAGGKTPLVALQSESLTTEYKPRTTSFVNVTFELEQSGPTHVAYLFYGPQTTVTSCSFVQSKHSDVTAVSVDATGGKYLVSFASLISSLRSRMKAFGFGSYAIVSVKGGEPIKFGAPEMRRKSFSRCDDSDVVISNLVSSRDLALRNVSPTPTSGYLLVISCFVIFLLLALRCRTTNPTKKQVRKQTNMKSTFPSYIPRQKLKKVVFAVLLFAIFYFYCSTNLCLFRKSRPDCDVTHTEEEFFPHQPPTIFISSLPACGAEILGSVFLNSTDFLYVTTDDVKIPVEGAGEGKVDPCYWPTFDDEIHPTTAGWFNSMSKEPMIFLNNLPQSSKPRVHHVQRRFRELGKSPTFVVNLLDGFWNTKLSWIHGLLPSTHRFVIIVRDPRDWIFALTRQDLDEAGMIGQQETVEKILHAETAECEGKSLRVHEYRHVSALPPSDDIVTRFARLWAADVSVRLRTSRSAQVVMYEDIVTSPEHVARRMAQRLGATLTAPQINHLIRTVHSGHYSFGFEPNLHANVIHEWKERLSQRSVATIENICGEIMKSLGYLTTMLIFCCKNTTSLKLQVEDISTFSTKLLEIRHRCLKILTTAM
uniref:Dermatan-sulfate epimerase-like protein n=1 Tax=Phallusia mammillata TaxID=59560 RepID=A0A6F9DBY1_9ASCI|nr:dermatan-sulfate epimerase-like protein [Phallusia mammillata]